MAGYLIYGKRTGKPVKNKPIYDPNFKALDAYGKRVGRLANAKVYSTKEAALNKIHDKCNQELVDAGLVLYDIRPAR